MLEHHVQPRLGERKFVENLKVALLKFNAFYTNETPFDA